VVSGTLLVTPNAVMFDPNVSDPLVLDQGAETYGVILPLEVIVHSGIFSDIAHMKVKAKSESAGGQFYWPDCGPLPYLYPNTTQRVQQLEEKKPPVKQKDKVLKRLSFPLTWMESLSSDHIQQDQAKSAPPTGLLLYSLSF
jgi:hypothetical protein